MAVREEIDGIKTVEEDSEDGKQASGPASTDSSRGSYRKVLGPKAILHNALWACGRA